MQIAEEKCGPKNRFTPITERELFYLHFGMDWFGRDRHSRPGEKMAVIFCLIDGRIIPLNNTAESLEERGSFSHVMRPTRVISAKMWPFSKISLDGF